MRRLSFALGVAAVAAALWMGLAWRGADAPSEEYVTAPVDRGPITAAVTATGTLSPVASVQVGTYVSGPVQSIFADFNTPVRKGQPLAKIDPRPFQVKVDAAAADLANARARLEKDRADAALKAITLRRQRELATQGIVAQSELDIAQSQDRQARAQLVLAEAEIVSAEARLRETQVNLAYTDIVSPVDGVVVSRTIEPGQTVAATFQTPTLFLVAEDLTEMQVSASVSESDIGSVAAGQEATFSVDAYPGAVFHGHVRQVRNAPVTIQNVVTYDVMVNVANPDLKLKPGMTANVAIVTASRPDALRVPTSALRFRPPADAEGRGAAAAAGTGAAERRVWVVAGDGSARPVAVTTGIADDRFTEITSGVTEGTRVAIALPRPPTAATAPGTGPSFNPMRRPR